MATTDTMWVLEPLGSSPTATLHATLDTISDASTPNAVIPVLDFDGATDEHMDWYVTIPSHYDGGGFTFSYKYAVDGTDVDIVEIELRMLDLADLDILTADLGIDTQTATAVQDTPAATPINKLNYSTTGAITHANAGSPAVGDRMVIRATRDVSAATNTDDLQLLEILILET